MQISAEIHEFDLERGFDFLSFGNGEAPASDNIIARLTGTTKLRRLASVGSKMWILFTTDNVVNNLGFHFEIKQIADTFGKASWICLTCMFDYV